jgi:transmembrane sensor
VTALGTRFSVRDQDQFSSLSVFEGAVRVEPKNNQGAPVIINAGESIKFTTTNSLQKGAADAASASWSQGFLIVDQLPLGEFIAELSRYRRGLLQCDSRVAQLLVSGSFPTDTDSALNILAHKFPIQIQTFTRYWTKVGPA